MGKKVYHRLPNGSFVEMDEWEAAFNGNYIYDNRGSFIEFLLMIVVIVVTLIAIFLPIAICTIIDGKPLL